MDIILTQGLGFISFPISFPSRFLTNHLALFDECRSKIQVAMEIMEGSVT